MEDFKSKILEALAMDQKLMELDTMSVLEDMNPEVTQKYNEGDELIFKQPISETSAEEICEMIKDTECSYAEYKSRLISKCNMVLTLQESPVEMIVYASKAIKDKEYYSAINDVLKELHRKSW